MFHVNPKSHRALLKRSLPLSFPSNLPIMSQFGPDRFAYRMSDQTSLVLTAALSGPLNEEEGKADSRFQRHDSGSFGASPDALAERAELAAFPAAARLCSLHAWVVHFKDSHVIAEQWRRRDTYRSPSHLSYKVPVLDIYNPSHKSLPFHTSGDSSTGLQFSTPGFSTHSQDARYSNSRSQPTGFRGPRKTVRLCDSCGRPLLGTSGQGGFIQASKPFHARHCPCSSKRSTSKVRTPPSLIAR